MNISDIAQLSGYSRQRINQLVRLYRVRGIERKPNGRLRVTDAEVVRKWCEKLRNRKEWRRQNNEKRKEWRDRLKIRRLWMRTDLAPVLREMHREVVPAMRDRIAAKFPDAPTENKMLDQYISDLARKSILKVTGAGKIRRLSFVLRGRRAETAYAREMLYDFSAHPGAVPEIRSYADIARAAGCTRAAVWAMAKQLPEGLQKRSGRLRSSPSRP